MNPLVRTLESRLNPLPVAVRVKLPSGATAGAPQAAVQLTFNDWRSVAALAGGQIARLAEDLVEERVRFEGSMRDLMAAASALLPGNPSATDTHWWTQLVRTARSLAGCAMSFEQGWMALHQMLASRPDGRMSSGRLRGAQSAYPFTRDYIYP